MSQQKEQGFNKETSKRGWFDTVFLLMKSSVSWNNLIEVISMVSIFGVLNYLIRDQIAIIGKERQISGEFFAALVGAVTILLFMTIAISAFRQGSSSLVTLKKKVYDAFIFSLEQSKLSPNHKEVEHA